MIKKITIGFVIQSFKDDGTFYAQEFVAGDQVDWEDMHGNPVESKQWYIPFDMVQDF